MKDIFRVLNSEKNKPTVKFVSYYLLSFLFLVMAIVDYAFSLSLDVFTLSIVSEFHKEIDVGFAYWFFYALLSRCFYTLMRRAEVQVDSVKADKREMSRIIILD